MILTDDSVATAKIAELRLQVISFIFQGWEFFENLPQFDAAIAKLALGLTQYSLVFHRADSGINQEIAIGELLFNVAELLLRLVAKRQDLAQFKVMDLLLIIQNENVNAAGGITGKGIW